MMAWVRLSLSSMLIKAADDMFYGWQCDFLCTFLSGERCVQNSNGDTEGSMR